jgi:hypothetical protein
VCVFLLGLQQITNKPRTTIYIYIFERELRVAGGDGCERREASFWRYEMNALAARDLRFVFQIWNALGCNEKKTGWRVAAGEWRWQPPFQRQQSAENNTFDCVVRAALLISAACRSCAT